MVITITIKTVSEEPVNPPKTTNTLTLKGEEWAEVIEKVVVYSEDGMSTHELTAVPAPFGKTEEWTAEIPEDVKAVKIVIDGNLEKAIDKAMDDDEVTVSADELAYAQSSKIKVTINGVVYYADNSGENRGKVTVPGMEDGTQFLAETYTSDRVTDSKNAKDGVLTIEGVSKDRVLYTACEVTLPADDESIAVTLKGRTNKDGEALEAEQYVAKNETLVITFTEGGSYKIDDQKAKAYAKGETVEVKVERAVEIVTYELPTDFQANIDEALKKVNFDVDSEKNGVEMTLDKETNTLRVEITDFSKLSENTQGTGTMRFLRDLTEKGYTVSLKSGTNSISLDGENEDENEAMKEYKAAILKLIQNAAVVGVENTITIDITINGLNGNSVSGQVILTATIPNP